MTRQSRILFQTFPLAVLTLLVVAACSGDSPTGPGPGTDPGPGSGQGAEPAPVDSFVATLGSWEQYAPPQSTEDVRAGSDTTYDATVEEMVEGALHNVTYQCTETPRSLTDTPEEIVMYEPAASVMWVGNLIQGESYKGGVGSFEELSIRQRDTLRLSIDLLTGDNFAVVPKPALTTVQSAIGELIQKATDAGHRSGSSIHYDETLTYSTEQAALKLGLSAKYMGARAKADLSRSRAANQRTLVAHFVQNMFTIAIELPQSPSDMFSDELTAALWQQQVNDGNLGPNNLPVYIGQITYGRTLTYSLTSTHSEDRMRAAIAASYDGLAGGGSGYTEAELRETLSQQNIRVTAIGGEGQNTLDLISSGNLKAYFTTDAPLTSAKPLSYQLNFLGDNSVAKVSETTTYSMRECSPKPASGGRFEFMPLQESAAPVPAPYTVQTGDFDHDGREDLVWSHTLSGSAQVAVGFGQVDATLDVRSAWTHPATPVEGWGNGYEIVVADVNADSLDDLVWNRRQNEEPVNAIYVALSNGDGTFDAQPRIEHPRSVWSSRWQLMAGDVDNADGDDLVWTLTQNNAHFIYVGLSNGDGTFTFGEPQSSDSNWLPYARLLADVDRDGADDIVWNETAGNNRVYVSRSNGDGTFTLLDAQAIGGARGWDNYTRHTGDFNRDGRADLLWVQTIVPNVPLHRALGQPDGRFQHIGWQGVPHPADTTAMHTLIGDFNGDGGDDVLWNQRGPALNHLYVGLSTVTADFEFTPLDQEHPASQQSEDWTAFEGGVLVLDVNGDGLDDVVWNERASNNRIYVARARPVGLGT